MATDQKITPSAFADTLRQIGLLSAAQWQQVRQAMPAEPKTLAADLVRRGWLTAFQARYLLAGRGQELVLGRYVLLDHLGAGGMGEVFKARQQPLGRIVALKVIRKERLQNSQALRRFQREIKAAARVHHPNLVRALEATEAGGTLLFAMEYVEGIDLARLVKEKGPLPVAQACAYIHQAACGLAHANELGLVHRDIKPQNLMLMQAPGAPSVGFLKILDLGLARQVGTDEESTLTQEGSILGTPDYLAPEQARCSHQADIRADIYSLGATFYFLLTGHAPFPGGSLTEKLMKHQLEEPEPVEKLRPDVPANVARILRKMMAKKPADRYQEPGEVAAALSGAMDQPIPSRRQARLRRRLVWATACLVLLTLFGVGATRFWPASESAALATLPQVNIAGPGKPIDASESKKEKPPAGAQEATCYLADWQEAGVKLGPWKLGKGTTGHPSNVPIKVNGIARPHGLGLHPPENGFASVQYRLEGRFRAFRAGVALDDSTSPTIATPLTFLVFGDGKQLWSSRPVQVRGQPQQCHVGIEGIEVLELRVHCPGTLVGAHAVWIDPQVTP